MMLPAKKKTDDLAAIRGLLEGMLRDGKDTEIVVLRKGERTTLKAKWTD